MAFDPDVYLAAKGNAGFDPDAYLAQRTPPKSFWEDAADAVKSSVDSYRKSQTASPMDFLQRADDAVGKTFNKAGEFASEELGKEGADPQIAAGVGTAIQMSPELAKLIGPEMPSAPETSPTAIKFARRALGFSKRMLASPPARQDAADAAKVALDEGIIPWLGNREVMQERALGLKERSGKVIGDLRSSPGPQPIDSVFNRLSELRNRLTEGGARGGEWDEIHGKIDSAEQALRGLYETPANQPIYEGVPEIIDAPSAPRKPLALPEPKTPGETFGPIHVTPVDGVDPVLYMKEFPKGRTPSPAEAKRFKMLGWDSVDTTDGGVVWGDPNYLASLKADFVAKDAAHLAPRSGNHFDFPEGNARYFDVDTTPPAVAEPTPPKKINRLDLRSVEKVKDRIAGKLNWNSDRNSQRDAKAITGALEGGVEDILGNAGVDMNLYGDAKRKYGASKKMLEGLDNALAAEEGNNLIGPVASMAGGVAHAVTGNIPGAAASLGLIELAKRRGAGLTAKALDTAARYPNLPENVTLQFLASLLSDMKEGRGKR